MANSQYSFSNFITILNNNFVIFLLLAVVFVGGFFGGSMWTENQMLKNGKAPAGTAVAAPTAGAEPAAPTGPTADQLANVPAVGNDEPVRGDKNATVTLVEYSDFECPFCGRFHPTMQQIMEEYEGKVNWVYRHYPLSFHPNAQKAAEASECVLEQKGNEAFWTYADAIFDTNIKLGSLTPDAIDDAAEAAGVNMTTFSECLDSGKYAQKVADQMSAGTAVGVSGTPGTFIITDDGAQEFISGAYPIDQVKASIDKYL
jgi:protein-disulfide isomerase